MITLQSIRNQPTAPGIPGPHVEKAMSLSRSVRDNEPVDHIQISPPFSRKQSKRRSDGIVDRNRIIQTLKSLRQSRMYTEHYDEQI